MSRFEWIFYWAAARQLGQTKDQAIDAADKAFAEARGRPVQPTVQGDLMRRARKVGELLEYWHTADTTGMKRAVRVHIRALVNELYTPDFCPKHVQWVHKAVARVCSPRSKDGWNHRMCCFYETLQKDIRKTGCADCPNQQRHDD
jgi:hypothetical protein